MKKKMGLLNGFVTTKEYVCIYYYHYYFEKVMPAFETLKFN